MKAVNGSALIFALLMTTAVIGFTSYLWYVASYAQRIVRKRIAYEYYQTATEGLIDYAIAFAIHHGDLIPYAQEGDSKPLILHITYPARSVGEGEEGHIALLRHNDTVYAQGTYYEQEQARCTISCEIVPEKIAQDANKHYTIQNWKIHAQ